jgi:hypothetical protein
MADISVGAAIGAGFSLIRRRPLAVLAWGAVPIVVQVAAFSLLAPYYVSLFGEMFRAAQAGQAPAAAGMPPEMFTLQALSQVLNLVQVAVSSVIYCAVFRAVLHPEQSAWAYMRLGAPEFFLGMLTFGAAMAFGLGIVVLIIPVAIIVGIAAAVSHSVAAVAILIPLFVIALIIAIFVVAVRFSLVGPMIVDDGKFHLLESWHATRGKAGSLFLVALALFGIFLAIEIVAVAIVVGVGAAVLAGSGGFAHVQAFFQQPPPVLISTLAPYLAGYVIVSIPIAGCFSAIAAAPWARAYLDLKADASEAFA